MKHLLSLLFFTFAFLSQATTFIPLTLDKQVESAGLGAEVVLQSYNSYKSSYGYIATEYNFQIVESFNFNPSEKENGLVKFSLPGGTIDGVTAMVDGAPNFKPGEKIFLLLKRVNNKIYLSNFTLGKFNIEKIDGEEYYVNEVFPKVPNVGRIKKTTMINLMKNKWKMVDEIKNSKLQDKSGSPDTVVVTTPEVKKERKPSSLSQNDEIDYSKFYIYGLAILGIIFSALLILGKKDEK